MDDKMVLLKKFYSPTETSLYQARLNEIGIDSFLSNSNVTGLMPFGDGGYHLHVRSSDLEEASKIVKQLDIQNQTPLDEDFRDATLEDIEYQKELNNQNGPLIKDVLWAIVGILFFLGLAIYLYREWIFNPVKY